MAVEPHINVTYPDCVGGGRMEPSATFGRGFACTANSRPFQALHAPLPELATLAPTSPSFAEGGD